MRTFVGRLALGRLAVAVAVIAGVVPLGGLAAAGAADGDVIAGAWIVTVAPGISPDAVAADHGRRLGAEVDHVYRSAGRGYAGRMSSSAAAAARRDGRVRAVVPDRVVRLAAKPGGGSGGGSAGESVPTGVARVAGGVAAGRGVPVAVVDTGIDLTHPDLVVGAGINCSSGSSYGDGNGHGTHVAGTIGAVGGNGRGVVGVAPGTTVHPVRVLNNAGSGSWSSIICGVNWVVARGITVANMSLGGTGSAGSCTDGGLRQAICDAVAAGVTVVVAAGNSAEDSAGHVPAAYDEVITVSALADSDGVFGPTTWRATCRTDQEDTLADFSNFGLAVDLIAPGVCVASTWKGGGYKTISGTSMASPHVAAGAALYLARRGPATPATVKAALVAGASADRIAVDDRDPVKEPLLRVDTL